MANATRPVVEIEVLSKRKRENSQDAPDLKTLGSFPRPTHDAKRRKPNAMDVPAPKLEKEVEKRATVVSQAQVKEAIDSQLGLEILLKHNELRLINQELAKCQVALEQLRRCHLIPYPSSQATSEALVNISNGTGPSIGQRGNVPRWAPPYGVSDGPYSRHYAKWLIPDPSFDGMQMEMSKAYDAPRAGKTIPEGRSTRNSIADGSTPGSKSRSQRGSGSQKLQSLPNPYPLTKEKAGPCILKRGDGQMVKLVCLDCRRDNFSSTQGFINHCRIAHHRDFKSHEEAAVASGQPIEVDDIGGIVGEERSSTAATGLVHPLITTAAATKNAYSALLSRIEMSMAMYKQGKLTGVTSIPTSANSTPSKKFDLKAASILNKNFVASSDTPHLSDLMRRRGFGGNLVEIVNEAKKPTHFDEYSSLDEESEEGEGAKRPTPFLGLDGNSDLPTPVWRMPARAAMSPAPFGRPGSSKGIDGRNGRKSGMIGLSPRLSNATPIAILPAVASEAISPTQLVNGSQATHLEHHDQDDPTELEMMSGPSINDLSPHTVASNNAPSLVSDDGEYDEGDDAESVSSADEDEGSDVAEIDIEDDGVDKVVPRTVLRNRNSSSGDMRLRKEEKHVTFVSPVKERRKKR